ncbi:hypothetical protein NC651_017500 [Populus alba x Populus x berolinensis]|nr:hypothetical protein NC651_017500 [Populus alba x Populus x berolinensis]
MDKLACGMYQLFGHRVAANEGKAFVTLVEDFHRRDLPVLSWTLLSNVYHDDGYSRASLDPPQSINTFVPLPPWWKKKATILLSNKTAALSPTFLGHYNLDWEGQLLNLGREGDVVV